MIYVLPDDNQEVQSYLDRLKGEKCRVELRKIREKRTLSQNNYLHLILGWFGLEIGYTLQEVKQDIFKRNICKDWFLMGKLYSGTIRRFDMKKG